MGKKWNKFKDKCEDFWWDHDDDVKTACKVIAGFFVLIMIVVGFIGVMNATIEQTEALDNTLLIEGYVDGKRLGGDTNTQYILSINGTEVEVDKEYYFLV